MVLIVKVTCWPGGTWAGATELPTMWILLVPQVVLSCGFWEPKAYWPVDQVVVPVFLTTIVPANAWPGVNGLAGLRVTETHSVLLVGGLQLVVQPAGGGITTLAVAGGGLRPVACAVAVLV